MFQKINFVLVFSLLMVTPFSCSQLSKNPHSSSDASMKPEKMTPFQKLLSEYWEEHSQLFPLDATAQGDHRFDDQFPNFATKEYREGLITFYKKYLLALKTINLTSLNDNDKISHEMLTYDLEMSLEEDKFQSWMIPFHQFWGIPLTFGQLGSGDSVQPFSTVKDYKNWISRLEKFKIWSQSAIENFRDGIKSNYVLPKSLVLKMIPQMEKMISSNPKESLFFSPIKKMPSTFSSQDKSDLEALYLKTIIETVNPTYQSLAHFLKTEYLPKARLTSGISSLPNGKKYYSYLAKSWTTTNKTPQEIYELGLREVKRIKTEMEKIKAEVNFKGSLKEFFDHLRNDPKFFPFKTPEEVLGAFRKVHEVMSPQLKKLFIRTPKTPFEIRQVEAFRQETASAEYQPGNPDGSRPGIFYMPIVDAKKFNITSGMESVFLHEAIPGHHYQTSLQQENESLPQFRKFGWYGAYGEGWALYTESLGKELGLYTDPYQYMGALGDEMHRALRLVVDVAIHTKGMSREAAIKYLMANEPLDEAGATAEIERYMAIPGQALSYKIGALKIWELRNKYAKKLGDKFSIGEFHDELLKDGCMPLEVMEQKLDVWAKNKK
ncbi:MAG: DUF885 domain-containing protein [Bacteriovoracaceae bacterium]|nr:DUF885 domain-containing protein [Bacteriovoracaceae bacterium]